jgi:hypothetical protein
MIFQIYQHYSDEESKYEENIYSTEECFVCYEIKTRLEIKPIYLKNQTLYICQCDCNGPIHNECLKKWYYITRKCPICRIKIIEKTNEIFIFSYINNTSIIVFIFIKQSLSTLLKYLIYFYFLFFCYVIYTTINLSILSNIKYKILDNKDLLYNHEYEKYN